MLTKTKLTRNTSGIKEKTQERHCLGRVRCGHCANDFEQD